LHGDSGYSRKGDKPEEASCYYSVTRLQAGGKISIGGREARVSGTAWMDHEFSSAPLSPKLAGWDWFSLRFQDGSDLMIYLMREKDGRFSPVSSGTFIGNDGRVVHLASGDFRIEPLKTWKSPHSGAIYPAAWLLEVFPLDLKAEVLPNLADQEMQTPESTRVTYWEGGVSARGTIAQGKPVSGEGYVELTGYSGEKVF
jgi:predicted secreted hydrolase